MVYTKPLFLVFSSRVLHTLFTLLYDSLVMQIFIV